MTGFDPKDSTSLDLAGARMGSGPVGQPRRASASAFPKEYRVDNMPAEIEALWQQGIDWARDAGAEIVEVSLPHTNIRAAGLLHHRAGRGLVEPRPL